MKLPIPALVDDRVATITLNRPERHNALSQPLVDEIMAAVAQADADPWGCACCW
jgi:enoyl-CoA hydratase/carnithine racemase